jgi:hypothetical protein
MALTYNEILFLAVATAIVIAIIVYMKYYEPPSVQCYEYSPSVMVLGANDSQPSPLSFETYKYLEEYRGRHIPMGRDLLHPSQMSTEQLEEQIFIDGLSMGPGLVEGNRFRGNLNL